MVSGGQHKFQGTQGSASVAEILAGPQLNEDPVEGISRLFSMQFPEKTIRSCGGGGLDENVDGTVALGATTAYDAVHAAATPYQDVVWSVANLMASPASVGFSRTDGYAWANRPDLVKPHASRIEQAAAVLKVYPVLAAQRVHASEAVMRALGGASSVSWLAACQAAAYDYGMANVGAYPAVTPPPDEHWLAAHPNPLAKQWKSTSGRFLPVWATTARWCCVPRPSPMSAWLY